MMKIVAVLVVCLAVTAFAEPTGLYGAHGMGGLFGGAGVLGYGIGAMHGGIYGGYGYGPYGGMGGLYGGKYGYGLGSLYGGYGGFYGMPGYGIGLGKGIGYY
ncbi:glycine-rich protein-like [Haliotis asinina]|uniref:glycine-rich protein-like n=1 Tax=Haliotis asinina TaxID=109174 RepID=UPI003531C13A